MFDGNGANYNENNSDKGLERIFANAARFNTPEELDIKVKAKVQAISQGRGKIINLDRFRFAYAVSAAMILFAVGAVVHMNMPAGPVVGEDALNSYLMAQADFIYKLDIDPDEYLSDVATADAASDNSFVDYFVV